MSEKITRYLLSEVKTIRITCMKCDSVVEVPIEKLGKQFAASNCKFCAAEFVFPELPGVNPFQELQQAAKAFAAMERQVEIQFVFPGD